LIKVKVVVKIVAGIEVRGDVGWFGGRGKVVEDGEVEAEVWKNEKKTKKA
jgi:hypothetical protein